LAVRLVRIVGEKFLMVIFRRIKFSQRLDSRDNRIFKPLSRIEFFYESIGLLLLFFVSVEDRRAILGSGVIALTIQRGWIVSGEKNRHQIAERYLPGIEFNLNCFGMTCGPGTDLLVGRVLGRSAGISGNH